MPHFPVRRLFLQWYRFLPYHFARVAASRELLGKEGVEVVGFETASQDEIYSRNEVIDLEKHARHTVFPGRSFHTIPVPEVLEGVHRALDELQPDAIAINGYGIADGRACLLWCQRNERPAILMSESWSGDAPRSEWKEWLKSWIIRQFDAALVGGTRQAEYIGSLGIPRGRVFTGYDAVDNDYFRHGAEEARRNAAALRARFRLPENYFLSSGRFVPEKNLAFLLEAYAEYRRQVGTEAFDLVLCGDGPLRPELEACAKRWNLTENVHFAGFVQYGNMPVYLGLSRALVHVSLVEPWGLVVNEAMASGLPVLVSDRCGCSPDLVQPGVNGYTFSPDRKDAIVRSLVQATREADLSKMGAASSALVERWSPAAFAEHLRLATLAACERRKSRRRSLIVDGLVRLSLKV
ncbi:MAG: glycosyltransferase [Planctomycetota bacterium]